LGDQVGKEDFEITAKELRELAAKHNIKLDA
jgi:hypothetical protein